MKNFTNIVSNTLEYQLLINSVLDLIKNRNILLLNGDLGSGKTFLVQQLMAQISQDEVVSPTFSLLNLYQTSIGQVYHYDLYRIKHQDELINLDIHAALISPLVIIEWPKIAEIMLIKFANKIVEINISYCLENSRNYNINLR